MQKVKRITREELRQLAVHIISANSIIKNLLKKFGTQEQLEVSEMVRKTKEPPLSE